VTRHDCRILLKIPFENSFECQDDGGMKILNGSYFVSGIMLLLLGWCYPLKADLFFQSQSLTPRDRTYLTEEIGLSLGSFYGESLLPLGTSLRLGLSHRYLRRPSLEGSSLLEDFSIGALSWTEITLTKGLYYDVDFFLSLKPLFTKTQFSSVGGGLRWGFYTMTEFPVHWVVSSSAQISNGNNRVIFYNQVFDLLAQYQGESHFVYTGLGSIFTQGTFIGGKVPDSHHSGTAEALESSGVLGTKEFEEKLRGRLLLGVGYTKNKISVTYEMSYVRNLMMGIKVTIEDFF
jgi:hypothetical protein